MSFYTDMTATALASITTYGADLTFRAVGTQADPVTGVGATAGADRTLKGLEVSIDHKLFPETRTQSGDIMLLIEGGTDILLSDKWVNGSDVWSIVGVKPVKLNSSDVVISKVLVRG